MTQVLAQPQVIYLRDFLLGYLAAKGGAARIDELRNAIRHAEERGIVVAAGKWSLEDEIDFLEHLGVLRRVDGGVHLVWERLPRLTRKKIEKVSRLVGVLA